MKIEDSTDKEITLKEFAERHNLELQINQRHGWWNPNLGEAGRYYCHFKDAWIKEGIMLGGVSGNGATKQEAIEDYTKIISDEKLIIKDKDRREILVPKLTWSGIKI